MRGDLFALGAVGALAAIGAANGSRAAARKTLESGIERPRFLFQELQQDQREKIEEAVEIYRRSKDGILGAITPLNMGRDMAMRSAFKDRGRDLAGNMLYGAWFDYILSGRNAFIVGPEMQNQLERTKLDAVQRWMLKPPFEAWYAALPGCEWRIGGLEDRLLPVKGVAVDFGFRMDTLSVLIWAPTDDLDNALRRATTADMFERLRKLGPGPMQEAKNQVAWVGNDLYVNVVLGEALAHPGGIEGWPDESWREALQHIDFRGWNLEHAAESAETRRKILQVVLGVILYLQADGADITVDALLAAARARQDEQRAKLTRTRSPGKLKKLQRKLDGKGTQDGEAVSTVVWLGRRIEEAALNDEGGTRAEMRRHWVRGHWKGVRTKAGSAIRWIQPYERGRGPAKVQSRTYRFDGDGEG